MRYHSCCDLSSTLLTLRRFAIWADLRLTGVSTRAPALPYGIHPDFAKSSLPIEIMDQAKLLATCNVLSLPEDDVITEKALLSLLQHLHAMTILFNDAADYGTSWEAPWNTIYDVAYALASLRAQLGEADGTHTRPLRLFLHAASVQFWSTTRKFVPFGGCHDYSLEQISRELSQLTPEAVSDGWHAAGGADNALLWSLANTCAAYLRQFLAKGDTPRAMPQWLRKCTSHVLKGMAITTYKSFVDALREMPFTENWTAAMAHPVFVWLTSEGERLHVIVQGEECALDSKEMSLFADLRLTFDDEIAVCTNSWLVVGPLDDHLLSGGAAPQALSTQKLPIRRNGDGHSFRCQLTTDPSVAIPVPVPGSHGIRSIRGIQGQ